VCVEDDEATGTGEFAEVAKFESANAAPGAIHLPSETVVGRLVDEEPATRCDSRCESADGRCRVGHRCLIQGPEAAHEVEGPLIQKVVQIIETAEVEVGFGHPFHQVPAGDRRRVDRRDWPDGGERRCGAPRPATDVQDRMATVSIDTEPDQSVVDQESPDTEEPVPRVDGGEYLDLVSQHQWPPAHLPTAPYFTQLNPVLTTAIGDVLCRIGTV